MKILRQLNRPPVKSCGLCYGTGNKELPSGDTKDCYNCKGKGVI